jgi:hypothetical protein
MLHVHIDRPGAYNFTAILDTAGTCSLTAADTTNPAVKSAKQSVAFQLTRRPIGLAQNQNCGRAHAQHLIGRPAKTAETSFLH